MSNPSANTILELLRKLSPQERLKVIAKALPEIEHDLAQKDQHPLKSLLGLCADLGPAPSAKDIDQARQEAWAGFPRGDF